MSQVSVEVRAMAEALNSGDLEAFLARTAEDVEFTSLVAEAEGRTFRGHAGVRAWWGTVLGAFQDPRWEVLDVRGSGDRAVAKSRLTATLADTEVEQTMWMAARLREGKLGWWAFFRTEHEALEAAGLRESAMSQENLDLVQRVVAAVNERDVDGYLACCADDIKLRTPWAAVEGVYEGPEAIRRFFADLQDWAPDFRLTIDRVEPIGATRALVFLRASLSGRASGLPGVAMSGGLSDAPAARDLSTATVYDFAGGKVTSIHVFLDRDQAVEAVGLRE